MIVTASASELQKQIDELKYEMAREKSKAAAQANILAERNREAVEELRRQTREMLDSDLERVRHEYGSMLEQTVRDSGEAIDSSFQKLSEKYESLREQLEQAINDEKTNIAVLTEQQDAFRDSYDKRRADLRLQAEQSLSDALARLDCFTSEQPCEWFLPGHAEVYRRQIGSASELAREGLFEAAIGICSNTVLGIELDELDTVRKFGRWYRYFRIFSDTVTAEHRLVTQLCRRLDGFSSDFYSEQEIEDRTLGEAEFRDWIDSEFFELAKAHSADYDIMKSIFPLFSDENCDTEKIGRALNENAALSEKYSAENIYAMIKSSGERLERETELICGMRSRLGALGQRSDICARLGDIMYECGLSEEPSSAFYIGGDKRNGVTAVFEDFGGAVSVEISIVPAFGEKDGKWYNCVGYCLSSALPDKALEKKLDRLIRESFEDDGTAVYSRSSGASETTAEQRALSFGREFRLALNGHL